MKGKTARRRCHPVATRHAGHDAREGKGHPQARWASPRSFQAGRLPRYMQAMPARHGDASDAIQVRTTCAEDVWAFAVMFSFGVVQGREGRADTGRKKQNSRVGKVSGRAAAAWAAEQGSERQGGLAWAHHRPASALCKALAVRRARPQAGGTLTGPRRRRCRHRRP